MKKSLLALTSIQPSRDLRTRKAASRYMALDEVLTDTNAGGTHLYNVSSGVIAGQPLGLERRKTWAAAQSGFYSRTGFDLKQRFPWDKKKSRKFTGAGIWPSGLRRSFRATSAR